MPERAVVEAPDRVEDDLGLSPARGRRGGRWRRGGRVCAVRCAAAASAPEAGAARREGDREGDRAKLRAGGSTRRLGRAHAAPSSTGAAPVDLRRARPGRDARAGSEGDGRDRALAHVHRHPGVAQADLVWADGQREGTALARAGRVVDEGRRPQPRGFPGPRPLARTPARGTPAEARSPRRAGRPRRSARARARARCGTPAAR